MLKLTYPPGFVVPAQPVQRDRPPTGPQWVHEIKHDGYRMIVPPRRRAAAHLLAPRL
jgi:ATP-dependent DNA ligase